MMGLTAGRPGGSEARKLGSWDAEGKIIILAFKFSSLQAFQLYCLQAFQPYRLQAASQ